MMLYMEGVEVERVVELRGQINAELARGFIDVGHGYERTTACRACGASVLPAMFKTHSDWHKLTGGA